MPDKRSETAVRPRILAADGKSARPIAVFDRESPKIGVLGANTLLAAVSHNHGPGQRRRH
jgi:hypothetical protein